MTTSAKNYTKNKTKQKTDGPSPGQMVKAKLCRQNHTQKHSHTQSQKEKKGNIYIYIYIYIYILNIYIYIYIYIYFIYIYIYHCSQSAPPPFGMICCVFRYSRDVGHIKLIVEIYSAAPEAAGRNFPFSSLFIELLAFSFGFGPASSCRSPEGVCSSLRQDGVNGAADSVALAHSGREEEGVWCVGPWSSFKRLS